MTYREVGFHLGISRTTAKDYAETLFARWLGEKVGLTPYSFLLVYGNQLLEADQQDPST